MASFGLKLSSALVAVGLMVSPALAQGDDLNLSEGPVANAKQAPESFSALAKRLMPAVVNITTSQTIATGNLEFGEEDPLERFNPFFGREDDGFRRQGSLGSGFVISSDGLIVTNDHVIKEADEIDIIFSDGDVLRAELIGTDPETDLAVLRVQSDEPLPFVNFADSDKAEVGDWVIAIGNPFGYRGSVSAGIISAKDRELTGGGRYDDFIQTDAAINRGNSGGPLFSLGGEVVGVNTAIISPTGGSVGLGFSIPANQARQITDKLIETGEVRRGWLGVDVQLVDEGLAAGYGRDEATGVIVTSLAEDGPAAKAGLEVGDLLLTFDGREIESVRSLSRIVADTEIGAEVDVELVRDRREETVAVTLGELEPSEPAEEKEELPDLPLADNPLGVVLAGIDENARRTAGISKDIEGAYVRAVNPNGPAFGKLRKGDVIVELGFYTVTNPVETLEALEKVEADGVSPLVVRVHRRGLDAFFSIELD